MTLRALGEVCAITTGGTPARTRHDFFSGGIPWVKIGDMADGVVRATDETISQAGLDNSSAKLFPRGTVLISIFATIGRTAILEIDATTNQAIAGLTPDESVDSLYLRYFLDSKRRELNALARGVAQPNINQKILRSLQIPLPLLTEQRRVANLMSRAEGIVRLRREALVKAEELVPALFMHMFGDPASNPNGWPVAELGEFYDVKGGKRLPKGSHYSEDPTEFRYIRGTDIWPDMIDDRDLVFLNPEIQQTIRRYVVASGDVVITIAGKIGVAAPVAEHLWGINLTENAAMIRPRGTSPTDPIFLSRMLNTNFVQQQIESLTGRVTIGKLALERIRLLKILLPPLEVQRRFASKVESVRAISAQQSAALTTAQATFDALLHQAFTA